MRRLAGYIHAQRGWPTFTWSQEKITPILISVRYQQGRLLGKMEGLGFALQSEATLQTIASDVTKSSEIEGEILPMDQVRSSIARKLGMDIGRSCVQQ